MCVARPLLWANAMAEGQTVVARAFERAQSGRTERDGTAFWALTAFAVVMYVVPGEWLSWAAPLRLALATAALSAALVVFRRLAQNEPIWLDGHRGALLIAFAALAAASIGWSVNPDVSRTTAFELAKLAAIYLTLVNVVTTWRRLAILCAALVLASLVTSFNVVQWWRAGEDLVEGFRARWVGVYADPNHMAMDVGLVVPLGVAFVMRRDRARWLRVACTAAVVLAVTAVVLSHSRGGFIGLCVAMAVWAWRERNKVRAAVLALAIAVGLLVFAPESFWRRAETVSRFEEDLSAMGRVWAWEVASRIGLDRPLLGVGAGGFRYAWPLYAPPEATRAYVAHNVFLDVVGELGWIGLCLFLAFAGAASGGAFRASSDETHGWLARALAASVAGYLVCALFSGYILSAHLYVLFGLAASADRLHAGAWGTVAGRAAGA